MKRKQPARSDPFGRVVGWAAPIAVLLVVCVAFLPLLGNGFVNWDDPYYFTRNYAYRGLSPHHLKWMFTTFYMGHYQPLSWLTHGMVYVVWGMDPVAYHLGNVLLHAANAVLGYFFIAALLRRCGPGDISGQLERALPPAVGALFFAIHPLRVEAVAWAPERQEVLCAFFFLLALLAYVHMHERQRQGATGRQWYVLSIACFALSLLSKATGLTLPLALLVLDVYPLRRLARGGERSVASVVCEKLPYALVSLGAVTLVFLAKQPKAMVTYAEHGVAARAAQAAYGLCFYVWKTIAPFGLSPLYLLYKPLNPAAPRYLFAGLAVLGVSAGVVYWRRRYPWAAAAWVSYVVLLLPLLGLVQSGPQLVADRYTYLACLPFAVLVAAGARHLWRLWERRRLSVPTACATLGLALVIFAVLGVRTGEQTRVWRDSFTLWSHVLAVEPANYMAYNNRGVAFQEGGEPRRALVEFNAAIRLNPAYDSAYDNRGVTRQDTGDLAGALADYTRALQVNPGFAQAYYHRGNARRVSGDLDGALSDYNTALRLDPEQAGAYNNRGRVRHAHGDLDAALADYGHAIRLDPQYANAYNNRAVARRQKGDLDGAIADFTRAVQFAERSDHRASFARNLASARQEWARRSAAAGSP